MHASEIIGKEVLDKGANRIGKVVDIDLNMPNGAIGYLVVRVGLTKKLNVPIQNIEKAGDRIILNITRDEIERNLAPAK